MRKKRTKSVSRVPKKKQEPPVVPARGGNVNILPGVGVGGEENGRIFLQSANGGYTLIVDDDGIHYVKSFR